MEKSDAAWTKKLRSDESNEDSDVTEQTEEAREVEKDRAELLRICIALQIFSEVARYVPDGNFFKVLEGMVMILVQFDAWIATVVKCLTLMGTQGLNSKGYMEILILICWFSHSII